MKKTMLAVLAVLLIAPAAFADNWGLGIKLGGGANDPKGLKSIPGTELDENGAFIGLEALYEFNLDQSAKVGVKVGVDTYGENTRKFPGTELTEETYAFPLTAYYKRDNGVQNLSWFAGAGVTFLRTDLTDKTIGFTDDKDHKTKTFPHIVVGGEYRFTEVFALGLEARWNFSAKAKKDGFVFSDRTGFGAALTGRFYF